jgi:hypothetical protein
LTPAGIICGERETTMGVDRRKGADAAAGTVDSDDDDACTRLLIACLV